MNVWHGICNRLCMKKTVLISTLMLAAALVYAAPSSERPESSVPTPAEKSEISREKPNLDARENADWQRLRAERREAREQILQNLRNSSAAEKKNFRQEFAKENQNNREEMPRFDNNFPKNQPRDQRPFFNRSENRFDNNNSKNPKWEQPGERPFGGEPPPSDWNRGNH